MLIEISEVTIEKLLECRKTKKRGFSEWSINSLMLEAVRDFNEKYGKGDSDEQQLYK